MKTRISRISIFILFSSMLAISCSKEEVKELAESIKSRHTDEHRGVYISKYKTIGILGDSLREDTILRWCKQNNFNEVTLYNINTILNTTTDKVKLNNFVGKAHAYDPPLKVSFVNAGTSSLDKSKAYITDAAYPNKPDALTSEYEFWNTSYSYDAFIPIMTGFTVVKKGSPPSISAIAPDISRQFYVSKFKDQAGIWDSAVITKQMINNSDKLLLVNYSATPTQFLPNNTKEKLQEIANEANNIHLKANVIVLFNVNRASADPNLFNYFEVNDLDHPFVDAFDEFTSAFDLATIAHKDMINIKGYHIYHYDEARAARPLTP